MRSFHLLPVMNLKNYRVYLALLLGLAFGLSIYSYWLVDVFPPLSKTIIVYTLALSLIGATGYFGLLELWILPALSQLAMRVRWSLIAASILTGFVLLFGSSRVWSPSFSRYMNFLLPSQTLEISVPSSPNSPAVDIRILRIASSVGDIPYSELDYRGWEEDGAQLVLKDPSNNLLKWSGPTGRQTAITFQKSAQSGTINISWNGNRQPVNLFSEEEGKYTYSRKFSVPVYASRIMILLLGGLNFFMISWALNLLIWNKRIEIFESLGRSVSHFPVFQSYQGMMAADTLNAKRQAIRDWAVVAGIIGVAILLRINDLGRDSMYVDEFNHLLAAKAVIQGTGSLYSVYQRSLLIVTIPVYASLRLLGSSLWAARLPGVIFNSLAIIPLYLTTRKINKPVAFLSCILYATSPWLIAVSRNVREYGYYPFYFYWVIYFMTAFIEKFPESHVILRDWRKLFNPRLGILSLALALPVVYAYYDYLSTFKVILVAYVAFALILASRMDCRDRVNALILGVLGAFIAIGLYVFFARNSSYLALNFKPYPLGYFLYGPEQQWYYNRLPVIPVLILLSAFLMAYGLRRINLLPLIFTAIFGSFTFFDFFLLYINSLPRYYLALQLWLLVLMAIGLYGIWVFLRTILPTRRSLKMAVLAAGILLFFNPLQVLFPSYYFQRGLNPVTEESYDDFSPVQAFLLKNAGENDILISKTYRLYAAWAGKPKFKATYIYRYDENQPRENVYRIIGKFDSGWIVIDDYRFTRAREPLPQTTFTVGDKRVSYLGMMGNQHVYRWCRQISTPECN